MAKAQRVLSVEIGYSLTQVCEMDYQSKHPNVYGVFSMKTPEGILNDGYVKLNDTFIQELKSYLAANSFQAKKVIFTVSSTKIASREAIIPEVKENKVRDMIITNITDYFPVDPSMYQFAHTVMESFTDESNNKRLRVMVMAAPSDILDGYFELARALQLDLVSIDYSGNSIFQALRNRFSKGVNLTVKIDERSSLLTVTNNGVITMQRSGIYGADQVVDIMMETDVYGDKLTYDAAIRTLRKNNLVLRAEDEATLEKKEEESRLLARQQADIVSESAITGDTSSLAAATVAAKQAENAVKMLRLKRDVTYSYEQLISSIVRVIDYYNSKNRDAAIDNIVITGIAADFWGFSTLLSNELGRDVEVLKDLSGTSINQGLHLQDISLGDYISVIGAGIGSVGFMPAALAAAIQEDKTKNAFATKEQVPLIVFVACVSVSVILGVMALVPFISSSISFDRLTTKKAELQPIEAVYNDYLAKKADNDYLLSMYSMTENSNRDLYELFGKIENALPTDTAVKSLGIDSTGMTINMTLNNKREAAAAIINLRTLDAFSDVSVTGITQNEIEGVVTVDMTVTCVYGINPALAADQAATEEGTAATDTATDGTGADTAATTAQ